MEMPIEPPKQEVIEQRESIKLIKNTKGFNWEIKLLEINIERLEDLNNQMISKFETGGDKNGKS